MSQNFVYFHYLGLQDFESYEIVGFIRCGISNQMVRPNWAFCVYVPLAGGSSYSKLLKYNDKRRIVTLWLVRISAWGIDVICH